MNSVLNGIAAGIFVLLIAGCAQTPTKGTPAAEEAKKRALQSARIHTELAGQYFSRRQYRVAIEEAEIALRADPTYAPAYNVLGLVYMDLQEDTRAKANFERALRIAPNDPDAHNNFGWFLCQRQPEQMERAVDHFMSALRDPLYETPEKTYSNAGICVLKNNEFERARTFFQKALVIHPNFPLAVLGLIEIDYKRGEIGAAKSGMTQYMQTYALTPESLWLAIQIERASGDHQAEASYVFQLQRRFPDSKEARALREGR
ncbi:type IV pilus assembly protein PilF [Nitrosomonas nitrosa]|uniref:Type IV pilus assembly protein PilF n=1 Tax=Nitrosomonas nitrosa TaxID=52442 RepID=A0A1I4N223_9PROT|nr:type IV pilus biogenesis/stability protein PilW [Nitrosomonas nitrosa]PTQ96192.1 type IV pilus assembly protein PilF [Nitrosomonas nitrosa]CAE6489814.1 Type IV pilus assembly protein PilF [Nitrosomonas nitrosa]SFM09293.1 type IV pilus assembly protein PilF [Nitrosomonas nitrosa]